MASASSLLVLLVLTGCGAPLTGEAQLPGSTRSTWVVLVHGSGDGPERWALPAIERLSPRAKTPGDVEWVAYDWREAAKDKLSAAERGQAEGEAMARALRPRTVKHLHVIAHSAGAHVAHGLEQALSAWPERPVVHLTLLDPFLGKGLDFEWGRSRFGTNADFVEQWLHRGDGVPGTEAGVSAAHVFDVTGSASKPAGLKGSEAHWWPIDTYEALGFGLSMEAAGTFDVGALSARFPRGQVEAVP